jgi:predicted amidophosphoribosyltransferase
MIPGMLFKALDPEKKTMNQIIEKRRVNCPECHGEVAIDSRFCSHCGHQMVVIKKCSRCNKNLTTGAKFCPSCGLDLSAELHCTNCQTKLPPGTRFCFNCGEGVSGEQKP